MAYAAQSDIQNAAGGLARLVEFADWDGDGAVDAAAIAFAQAAADGVIDASAALRYDVPISDPTDTLKMHAAKECIYQLKFARGMVTALDAEERDQRTEWLALLRDGKVRPANPAPAKSDAVRSAAVVNNRDVSRENLKGYI